MSELDRRIAALSPQQKALLELRLKQKGLTTPKTKLVIQPRKNSESLPLSYAQERLWVLHQLQPDVPFYNEVNCFRLTGSLDVTALEQSFNAILKRHEVLRTNFVVQNERPIQVIKTFVPFTLSLNDLTQESEKEAKARQITVQEAQKSFDLAKDPLFRVKLLCLGTEEHILVLVLHHIVCDGWSVGVFIKELTELYKAFCADKASPLPELPVQYADYAIWQRSHLQKEVLEPQLNYWKKQLSGNLPVLELPTTRPRPTGDTGTGATQSFCLSQALTEALETLSQQESATLFMTLLAAFKILLYRYTNLEDILVGTPIANRNLAELEGAIGLFLNTLVLRTNLSNNPSFRELLQRVREVALEAYGNQDLPFEKLVEELQPERNLTQSPLFQVMFILQSAPRQELELPSLAIAPWDIDNGTSTFDLTLSVEKTAKGLNILCEYNSDRFEMDAIARMLGHYQTLLENIVTNPETPICNLLLLTSIEQHQLLVEWGHGEGETERHGDCIHQLFEAQIERTPNAIALTYNNQQLTYQELDRLANLLAQYLQFLGVEPEIKVGICLEYSLEIVVAILGVLKAGGAYVPLDPAYPQERLAFMLDDAQISILLTQSKLIAELPQHNAKLICLDPDWETHSLPLSASPRPPISPSNLAYIIYTSGSTDKPKGVMVTHDSLVNAYYAWEQAYELRAQATSHLQMASFSFDVFTGNLVRALCSGGKLVLCPRDFLLVPEKLYQLMRQEKIDCAEFVPAVLRNLIKYLEETEQSLEFMRLLIVGSDSWYGKEHQSIQRFCGLQTRLINSYGVTEATIDTTYFEMTNADLSVDKLVPIGRPFPNNQVYVLDKYLQPVAIAVPGELYIGGAGVARGYLNRPDLTAQKFISNPFLKAEGRGQRCSDADAPPASLPLAERARRSLASCAAEAEGRKKGEEQELIDSSNRLYKTGDLVRYLPDGNLEFLGRSDNQVKIRGFRIELSEIEAVLSHHPAVKESVVIVREDEPGNKRLVAYVVAKQKSLKSSDLYNYLQEKLPKQMLPSTFVILESFPLTPNGKIDRRSLPEPDNTRHNLEAEFIAPKNRIEETLVTIWSEVLGVKQVGIYDNFFELGGDSILSISAIAKANQKDLRLTPRQLFQHQTIAELAKVVDTTAIVASEQGLVTGSVPLTPIQHWFFAENFLDPHHWNQSMLLEIRQKVDPMLLKQTVQQLLLHHDALRLRFRQEKEGWKQINQELCICPPNPPNLGGTGTLSPQDWRTEGAKINATDSTVPFSQFDLSILSATEQKLAILNITERLQASFNLSEGSILQVALFNLGEVDFLFITIHHLAVDGVSWRILLEDLQTAYQQLSDRKTISLPPKTTSFKQWSKKLIEYSHSVELQQELPFWLDQLSKQFSRSRRKPRRCTARSLRPLPIDFPGGINTVASSKTVTVALSVEETTILLKQVPAACRTKINDVLLTALVLAFDQWTGNSSLLVDLESHGREAIFDDVDLSRTVGWFTAVFPVWLELSTKELGEALKAVKEQLRRIPNQGIGYGILRYLSQKSQLSCVPQAEVSFNYLGQFDQSFDENSLFALAKESFGSPHSLRGSRSYLLEIDGFVADGQLQVGWTYSEALHQRITIEQLAESFLEKLRSLLCCEAETYTPSDFPLVQLTQEELDAVFEQVEFVGV